MDRKIRVGAVSYLNAKPLIYGFEKGLMQDKAELVIDYPAAIANALLNDEIDIGLVPVAILPYLKKYYIIGEHCIACDGEVASVCLFSEVPLQEIETVLLDYQSRTSVLLVQILLKELWKISPRLEKGLGNFQSDIKGTTAGVVIGDRALEHKGKSAYAYDLGSAWKELTGLPFVFAVWASNKELNNEFIEAFKISNEYGLSNLEDILLENASEKFDLKKYYTSNVKYYLNDDMRKALKLFHQKIQFISNQE